MYLFYIHTLDIYQESGISFSSEIKQGVINIYYVCISHRSFLDIYYLSSSALDTLVHIAHQKQI